MCLSDQERSVLITNVDILGYESIYTVMERARKVLKPADLLLGGAVIFANNMCENHTLSRVHPSILRLLIGLKF